MLEAISTWGWFGASDLLLSVSTWGWYDSGVIAAAPVGLFIERDSMFGELWQ